MGLLDQPYGAIDLHGLAAAELDCVGALLFGTWQEIGHHTLTLAGTQFVDRDRGLLYDAIAGLRLQRPRIALTALLNSVPDHLVPAISVVLRWSDRAGFEPTAEVFCAARDALCHDRVNVSLPTYPGTA